MKSILFITFCFFCLTIQSQEITTKLHSEKALEADSFIGVDEFQNTYYIKENILYKKTSKQLFSYSNVGLGKLSNVNIQNPFKIILFYAEFNAAIILDNNLNELTQKIDFTKETQFNNVVFVTGASQNNLWLYADDNKLHLYDYQNYAELLQTQPTTFYDPDFIPKNIVSTFKKIWVLSVNTVLEFNEYGIYTKSFDLKEVEQIFSFQKGFIFFKQRKFFYQEPASIIPIRLDYEDHIESIYINSAYIFIFDGKSVYQYQIMRWKLL